jgi:hypothetical protein
MPHATRAVPVPSVVSIRPFSCNLLDLDNGADPAFGRSCVGRGQALEKAILSMPGYTSNCLGPIPWSKFTDQSAPCNLPFTVPIILIKGTDNPNKCTENPNECTVNPNEGTNNPNEGTNNPNEGIDNPNKNTNNAN